MALNPKKHEMPVQEANKRAKNFEEVALGYTEQVAVAEAERCLNCKNKPCVDGCPVNVAIPDFILNVRQKDVEGAYSVPKVLLFLRYAAEFVRRKHSAKANALWASSLNP